MSDPKEPFSLRSDINPILMTECADRDRIFQTHPVVTDKAKIPTPAIKEVTDTIRRAIVHRDPGVAFVGHSRFGKTFAIDVIKETLPQSFPEIPIYSVAAKEHDRPTERSLYTDLLMDCQHGVSDSGTALARRIRLLNLWLATVRRPGGDRLILFVDEAQNWGVEDFTRLRDLSNDMALNGYRLITILFAHFNLLSTRASLLSEQRTDLIGRFLLHPGYFRGASTISDTIEIMKSYDDPEISEFPKGSHISYSEFFLPQKYRGGWRLEQEAGACWAAFEAEAGNQKGHYQVGMQWMSSAIRNFLYLNWQQEHGEPADSGNLWMQSVSASGFADSLSVTQPPSGSGTAG